jgi:hypothetical protein
MVADMYEVREVSNRAGLKTSCTSTHRSPRESLKAACRKWHRKRQNCSIGLMQWSAPHIARKMLDVALSLYQRSWTSDGRTFAGGFDLYEPGFCDARRESSKHFILVQRIRETHTGLCLWRWYGRWQSYSLPHHMLLEIFISELHAANISRSGCYWRGV